MKTGNSKKPTGRVIATLLVLIFMSFPVGIYGQNSSSETNGDKSGYEPYKPGEFPGWAHSLRRFEVIFFGAIPFAFLFTGLGYDIYSYVDHDFDENYLPLFLGSSPEKEAYTQDTIEQRIAVSISLSAILALVDFFIDRRISDE